MENRRHVLGGRPFVVIGESTLEHDLTFTGICETTGLGQPSMRDGEDPEGFARRLLGELLASGRALELLACLLIPEGTESTDWTPELAAETKRHLAGLTAAEDKAQISKLLTSAVADFFESGLACSLLSMSFSESRGQPVPPLSALAGLTVPGER